METGKNRLRTREVALEFVAAALHNLERAYVMAVARHPPGRVAEKELAHPREAELGIDVVLLIRPIGEVDLPVNFRDRSVGDQIDVVQLNERSFDGEAREEVGRHRLVVLDLYRAVRE